MHSILRQLLAHNEEIIERLQYDAMVDVLYLDFAKAFDKAVHGMTMRDCRKLGITGGAGLWIS